MPLAVEFAVVFGCSRLGLGIGGGAMALPIRDFGLFFASTSSPLSRVSSWLARKLAVLANVLMSSTACSRLPLPEPFSITSINRREFLAVSHAPTLPCALGVSKRPPRNDKYLAYKKPQRRFLRLQNPFRTSGSYCHPFWRTPHCFRLPRNGTVT